MVLRLEADRGVELGGVGDAGQAHRANDDPLVGDAEAHVLGQAVCGEEVLERVAELLGLLYLAVAEDAVAKRARRRSR